MLSYWMCCTVPGGGAIMATSSTRFYGYVPQRMPTAGPQLYTPGPHQYPRGPPQPQYRPGPPQYPQGPPQFPPGQTSYPPRPQMSPEQSLAQQAAAWAANTPQYAQYATYPPPDPSKYQYDTIMGCYYDPSTRLYYDAKTKKYYNSMSRQFMEYDYGKQTYLPCADQNQTAPNAPAGSNSSQEDKKIPKEQPGAKNKGNRGSKDRAEQRRDADRQRQQPAYSNRSSKQSADADRSSKQSADADRSSKQSADADRSSKQSADKTKERTKEVQKISFGLQKRTNFFGEASDAKRLKSDPRDSPRADDSARPGDSKRSSDAETVDLPRSPDRRVSERRRGSDLSPDRRSSERRRGSDLSPDRRSSERRRGSDRSCSPTTRDSRRSGRSRSPVSRERRGSRWERKSISPSSKARYDSGRPDRTGSPISQARNESGRPDRTGSPISKARYDSGRPDRASSPISKPREDPARQKWAPFSKETEPASKQPSSAGGALDRSSEGLTRDSKSQESLGGRMDNRERLDSGSRGLGGQSLMNKNDTGKNPGILDAGKNPGILDSLDMLSKIVRASKDLNQTRNAPYGREGLSEREQLLLDRERLLADGERRLSDLRQSDSYRSLDREQLDKKTLDLSFEERERLLSRNELSSLSYRAGGARQPERPLADDPRFGRPSPSALSGQQGAAGGSYRDDPRDDRLPPGNPKSYNTSSLYESLLERKRLLEASLARQISSEREPSDRLRSLSDRDRMDSRRIDPSDQRGLEFSNSRRFDPSDQRRSEFNESRRMDQTDQRRPEFSDLERARVINRQDHDSDFLRFYEDKFESEADRMKRISYDEFARSGRYEDDRPGQRDDRVRGMNPRAFNLTTERRAGNIPRAPGEDEEEYSKTCNQLLRTVQGSQGDNA